MSRRKKQEVPTWVLVAALLLIVGIGLMAAGCGWPATEVPR